jgi:hypothetical protein
MADDLLFSIKDGRAFIEIKASPNASKTAIAGIQDGRLRIRVAAAPEDGRANLEIRVFLSKLLDCPKSGVILEAGEKSKAKTISIPEACLERLRTAVVASMRTN